ncbi:hypothetical protein DL769_005264 [Monosporascus sp. CRB-8-3]|nr:hypothetical protein DL769_005264 [Monosporascus sp. CRB-8-3]
MEHITSLRGVILMGLAFTASTWASPCHGSRETFDFEAYKKPESKVRPRFRYWLPDASVDENVVMADIASASSVGAGGVEFLPFYEYGGGLGVPTGVDWSTYNFGTPPFRKLFRAALRAHEQNGLVMDFAIGPNQGQGVPARADDDGLQAFDLVRFVNKTYDEYTLASGSLVEQTSHVHQGSGKTASTIFDNGSFVVDHFDAKGANVVAKFWEEHMLRDGIPDLLAKVGNYAWEDSVEITSNVSWSRSLPARFEKALGYSLKPYLPLLTFQQNNLLIQPADPGPFLCFLDATDKGAGYINDFRAALTLGYQDYLDALTKWSHRVLRKQVSVQPAYGLPIDMQASVPAVDSPECESLSFRDSIDSYRQFTGPAYLVGKRVVSNELGAVSTFAYRYPIPDLLFSANRGFAGGVNQYVIHGQTYTGNWTGTSWPGHTPFNYLFSELWSWKQPAWDHGLREALDYMARMQYTLQSGIPKLDVAIYNKESATTFRTVYSSNDLLAEGWSYSYLSPDNLLMDQAVVQSGALASNGPAWKALVVEGAQNVSLTTVRKLQEYAEAGLPIVVSGGLPHFYPSGKGDDVADYDKELSELLRTKNVHSVSSGQVASKLASLGLRPRVAVATNGTWYTGWRGTDDFGCAFVYSDLVASSGTVMVSSTRKPYYLNPWTGEVSPVLIYRVLDGTTAIPLSLAGNQTCVIAFSDNFERRIRTAKHSVKSLPPNVIGAGLTANGDILLHAVHSPSVHKAELSNGRAMSLNTTNVPKAMQLSNWNLTAEHWEAPIDVSDASSPPVKHNTTHQLKALTSWTSISGLVNTSGVGYYTTTLNWPPTSAKSNDDVSGAYISFSKVLHTLRVAVNGKMMQPMDLTNANADISPYLRSGSNTILQRHHEVDNKLPV